MIELHDVDAVVIASIAQLALQERVRWVTNEDVRDFIDAHAIPMTPQGAYTIHRSLERLSDAGILEWHSTDDLGRGWWGFALPKTLTTKGDRNDYEEARARG